MTYTPLIPPRDYPMFKDMKPKEAKEFFEWFVSEMDNRIEILKQVVKEDDFNMKFDYSPESLISLWEWYETKIKYIEKSEEEYKKDLEGRPSWMIPLIRYILDSILNQKKMPLLTNPFYLALNMVFHYVCEII